MYMDEYSTETRHSSSCCDVLRAEFRIKNIGFNFPSDAVFTQSQWPCPRPVFLTYRLLVAAYAVTITFLSIVRFDHDIWRLPWPVWLTNWSYLLLTCHLLCAAIIQVLDCITRQPMHSTMGDGRHCVPCYLKFNWFLFAVATPAAFTVTTVYFTAVFPTRHRDYISAEDWNLHLLNSGLMLLELALNAMPVRLLHAVYVWLYGICYVLFSVFYWVPDHTHTMYPGVLDWNVPRTTSVVLVVLAVVGVPLLQAFIWAVYRLRLAIYRRCVAERFM